MLQPDFDPEPTEVRIHPCRYVSNCKARGCQERATLIAEKVDGAGRHVRQIELCQRHCGIVIERERKRGLEISDRRNEFKEAADAITEAVMGAAVEGSDDCSSTILIYTDGACDPNPGRGGWGARIVHPNGTWHDRRGSAPDWTTNNRMEMTGVLMGLRAVTEPNRPVIVRSDSQYVIRTLRGEYRRRKNPDLWKDIDREMARFSRIRFEWVRGHAGDVHNEAADRLANAGAAQAPCPNGAPPAPTTQPTVREARGKLEGSRSRLRCSRCKSRVRRRRRFPGELRCGCGFTRRPELQNGGTAPAVGKKSKETVKRERAEYQERSRRRAVEKVRRLMTEPVTVPSTPSAASSDALTQQHRAHHRGEFPNRCAHCRREAGSTER